MEIILIFIALGLLLGIIFHGLKASVDRKVSLARMHAVRDEFVWLVAEKKLERHNRIFEYYYARSTYLLEKAPHVGIDIAMDSLCKLDSDDFREALNTAKKNASEILESIGKNENEEVSSVISMYYSASRDMILAHSSKTRMLYIFLFRLSGFNVIGKHIFRKISSGLAPIPMLATKTIEALLAAQFADEESQLFFEKAHH